VANKKYNSKYHFSPKIKNKIYNNLKNNPCKHLIQFNNNNNNKNNNNNNKNNLQDSPRVRLVYRESTACAASHNSTNEYKPSPSTTETKQPISE